MVRTSCPDFVMVKMQVAGLEPLVVAKGPAVQGQEREREREREREKERERA